MTWVIFSLFIYLFLMISLIYENSSSVKRILSTIFLLLILVTVKLDGVPHYTKSDIEFIKNEILVDRINHQINVPGVNDRSTPIESKMPVNVNGGVPFFELEEVDTNVLYHNSEPLDELGRATMTEALIGHYSIPAQTNNQSLAYIVPSGWLQKRYTNISRGGWLYNKTHLIPYGLTGNSHLENMITGTNYLNNELDRYVKIILYYINTYEMTVRVRVTPAYTGNNLLPSGIYFEAFSVEDLGESIMINSYIPNRQPGIDIDYKDGSSEGPDLIIPNELEKIIPKDRQHQIKA